jgi:hypothetical protein
MIEDIADSPEIGDRVRLTDFDGEIVEGILRSYLPGTDFDDSGYWLVNDEGEEYEILFHALFREEQKSELIK